MSELRSNLREEFHDKEYRHSYADESLNTYIATQIKVLREQQKLTQKELADLTGMAQPRIALLEDINYSSWSINTLRRIAEAFDLRLSVRFETFSSLIPETETFSREALERAPFKEDTWFHKKDVQAVEMPILRAAYAEQAQSPERKLGKILHMSVGSAAVASSA
ncbi:MAG TPA: XRE family transcriptional regulator [Candidatus Polarisedimenticolia bacterium]|nr:XRE family transcriptional regulator [Candidatus Polarisedimenticolia bacterium]